MKTTMKRTLLAGATVATLGLGLTGAGLASAATDTSSTGPTALIDKIATTFNIDRNKVAELFTQDRAAHQTEMQQKQAERLAAAVKDGKLTQAQADYITNAQKDIQALMDKTEPGQEDDATRESIRTKMDALRTWADDNNVDMRYVGPGGGHGHGGPGGPGAPDEHILRSADDSSSSN